MRHLKILMRGCLVAFLLTGFVAVWLLSAWLCNPVFHDWGLSLSAAPAVLCLYYLGLFPWKLPWESKEPGK